MKIHAVLFLILVVVWSCGGSAEETTSAEGLPGKAIYTTNCVICHGPDGRKGLSGAQILPESKLSIEERIAIITNGKGNMMAFKDILSNEEIKEVASYTLSLK